MDDFFLPPDLRTPQQLVEPGGNIHYERFQEEVLPFLEGTAPFSYQRFDCTKGGYSGQQDIHMPLRIVEGSYCMHKKFREAYSYRVFLRMEDSLQEQRIAQRNGQQALQVFREKWIPMENNYFKQMDVEAQCDLSVDAMVNL